MAGERISLGRGTGGVLIPDSFAAVRRRFRSRRMASKDGAGDEHRVPGALTVEVIPILERVFFLKPGLSAARASSDAVVFVGWNVSCGSSVAVMVSRA